MPNWVRNIVVFEGKEDEIEKIFDLVYSEEEDSCFDFNKVIPMPDSLNVEAGSLESLGDLYSMYIDPKIDFFGEGHKLPEYSEEINNYKRTKDSEYRYSSLEKIKNETKYFNSIEDALQIGKTYFDNFMKYGFKTWFDWCNKNWGTKWNACSTTRLSQNMVMVDTAWDFPKPIFEELSKEFNGRIVVYYADEALDVNNGLMVYEKGAVLTALYPEPYTYESESFSQQVWDIEDTIIEREDINFIQNM